MSRKKQHPAVPRRHGAGACAVCPPDGTQGPAHAIFLARQYIDQDVLIIFNDTLFDADLSQIETHQGDGIIWV